MKHATSSASRGIAAWLEARDDPDGGLRELGRDVRNAAFLHGDFVLSSGERSSYYFDKYLFETRPSILRRLARQLSVRVPEGCDRIAGAAMGGVAIATALSLETGIPFVIIKLEARQPGSTRWTDGELHPGEHVLLVEDVVTTGTRALRAAAQVQALSAEVIGVLSVVDRQEGGAEAISAAGFPYSALFSRSELGV